MQRFKFRLLPSLAAAALALSACENSKSVSAPAPAVNESAFHTSAAGKVVVRAPGAFLTLDAMSSSAVIGSAGGSVSAGATRIGVPAGVVADGTVFTINVSQTNIFQVSLTATSAGAPEGSNDVGAAGFSSPVLLYFDYGATPPSSYSVAWQIVNGVLVPVPSRVEGNFVIGQLNHFSTYVVQEPPPPSDYVVTGRGSRF
jgi:hypothetical protein